MRAVLARALPILLVGVYGVAVWWRKVLSPPEGSVGIGVGNLDQYLEHLPMAHAGFAALREGQLPLWNPFQLTGMPFLAVPHTGLLYPGHVFYWFFDVPLAIELTASLHVVFGGACMLALGRQLGMRWTGSTFAACVLMTSGHWLAFGDALTLHRALAWLPATALAIERTLQGGRWAPLGLAAAMAAQALLGATEFFVYNSLGAILYGAIRAAAMATEIGAAPLAFRAGTAVVAAAAGVGLASVQLLPSLEVAGFSARQTEGLGLEASRFLADSPTTLLEGFFSVHHRPAIGILAAVGLLMGPGRAALRSGWLPAIAVGGLGVAMALGGTLYELYYSSPLGGMFRYTHKWLMLAAFGGALLAGLAVTRLETWRGPPALPVAVAGLLAIGALVFAPEVPLPGVLAALGVAVFALVPKAQLRVGIVAVLAGLDLFWLASNDVPKRLRPLHLPHAMDTNAALWEDIGTHVGGQRVYVPPELMGRVGVTMKQGTLRQVRVLTDYEPLVSTRYRNYVRAATGWSSRQPFAGFHPLGSAQALRWFDWTATRLYIVPAKPHSESLAVLRRSKQRGEATVWRRTPRLMVYERPTAFPRAWIVPEARFAADEDEALAILGSEGFSARRTVVLEDEHGTLGTLPNATPGEGGPAAQIAFLRDDSEHIELRVSAPNGGWLVLADAWYPGWEARIDGVPAPIQRANSLFRAVPVAAGDSVVTFDFRPASLRRGATLSAISAAVLVVLCVVWQRRAAPRS